MDKPIFDENKKRSREEDGNETSGANDSANSVSDLSEQDKYLEPTAHQGSIDRSMNYMMPPFVPDQKAYEA